MIKKKLTDKTVFHEDRLIVALNKYWRPLTKSEYLKTMDIPTTNEAIQIAKFPEEVTERIWEVERKPFAIFSKRGG